MNPRFEAEVQLNFQSVYALQKASTNAVLRASIRVCAVVCTLDAMVLWGLHRPGKWWVTACALLVLGVAALMNRLVAWLVYSTRNRKVEMMRYCFDEAGMHFSDSVEAGIFFYDGFVKLLESEAYYFLFVQKHAAHVLPKADFTRGAPAEFAAFLEEKTGKSVIRVRG